MNISYKRDLGLHGKWETFMITIQHLSYILSEAIKLLEKHITPYFRVIINVKWLKRFIK